MKANLHWIKSSSTVTRLISANSRARSQSILIKLISNQWFLLLCTFARLPNAPINRTCNAKKQIPSWAGECHSSFCVSLWLLQNLQCESNNLCDHFSSGVVLQTTGRHFFCLLTSLTRLGPNHKVNWINPSITWQKQQQINLGASL